MKNLLGALLKAQQEFPTLVKDATNPAFRSRYATLGAVQETAFPILHKHGLYILQSVRTEMTDKGMMVYVGATLTHPESGEQTSQELGLMPTKPDPQGVGSAITYGRRYLLTTMLGLAGEDDDGNAASRRPTPRLAQNAARPPMAPARTNGNGVAPAQNGAPDFDADPFGEKRPNWRGVADAIEWGVDLGAFDEEADARNELKRILQAIYPGRESCKPHELPAVLDAWYAEVRRRLARRQPA